MEHNCTLEFSKIYKKTALKFLILLNLLGDFCSRWWFQGKGFNKQAGGFFKRIAE